MRTGCRSRSRSALYVSILSAATVVAFQASAQTGAFHGPPARSGGVPQTNAEAQAIVDRIAAGVPLPEPVFAFVSVDDDEVPNAWADIVGGRHMIGFNKRFMADIRAKSGNYWSIIGIAAHEVGHHIYDHTTQTASEDCDALQRLEINADYFSGWVLGRLGAKYEDATSAIRQLKSKGSCSHPSQGVRLLMVGQGYNAGNKGQPSAPAAAEKPATPTSSSQALTGFTTRHNRDIDGHDLIYFTGVSREACAERCGQSSQCKAFAFDRWKSVCYLKSGISTSNLDPSSMIAVKKPAELPNVSKTAEVEIVDLKRSKFADEPNATSEEADAAACRKSCYTTTKCVAFTYFDKTKSCQHFKESSGHLYFEGATSGFKRQVMAAEGNGAGPTSAQIDIRKDHYFKGDGYKKAEGISQSQCEAACRTDRRCKALEYDPAVKTCRSYASAETPVPDKGPLVGFKAK